MLTNKIIIMKLKKVCAFGNMKGGVGKSTILSVVANYIHNSTDYKICVVDADDLQGSLETIRELDIKKEGAETISKYDLLTVNSNDFPEILNKFLLNEYDFIFVDLPGNLKQAGVISSYGLVDYIFIPTSLSTVDLDSTMKFVSIYNSDIRPLREKAGLECNLFAFLNKVNKQMIEYKNSQIIKDNFLVPFLINDIGIADVSLQRYASTINNYTDGKGKEIFKPFCEEILSYLIK